MSHTESQSCSLAGSGFLAEHGIDLQCGCNRVQKLFGICHKGESQVRRGESFKWKTSSSRVDYCALASQKQDFRMAACDDFQLEDFSFAARHWWPWIHGDASMPGTREQVL